MKTPTKKPLSETMAHLLVVNMNPAVLVDQEQPLSKSELDESGKSIVLSAVTTLYPQDFSGAASELATILNDSGLGAWEVKETKDGTTFRVGKGPTVTYFDEKGQIIITGRRDTGYRAIVE